MSMDVVEAASRWQRSYRDKLGITFHGGEPLVAGVDFYLTALSLLQDALAHRRVRFSMQSNLWLLTDELCAVLKKYNVSIGTSLDGPERITDAQRGHGYFKQTMKGIELARSHGIDVGCICTFTPSSLPHLREIFDFFVEERLNFTVHACTPSLRQEVGDWALSAGEHGRMLADSLDLYLENLDQIKISTLDSLCRSVSAGRGGVCTFGDCLGEYLAVGPDGSIYPCQRFAGIPSYAMGNVLDAPFPEKLRNSRVWRMFANRQNHVREECGDCAYFNLCRGGCPYNALVAGNGQFRSLKDPHCAAYGHILTRITDQALDEVFSEENIREVVARPDGDAGLLRRGKLLSLMRNGPHPYETARNARRLVAAVVLGTTSSAAQATEKLQSLGLLYGKRWDLASVQALQDRLNTQSSGYNKLYLHVTFACNLRCSHCYAEAGSASAVLSVDDTIEACREAARLGFQGAVITGGEPLMHPERDRLLDGLASIREEVKPTLTVLRTNLAVEADDDLLKRIGLSADEVVVSVDGDRKTHDERRGKGSYDRTVRNLETLKHIGYNADLKLAATLAVNQANGAPGDAVRALAKELDLGRPRFRPLLPLGRAARLELEAESETTWGHMDPREIIDFGYAPSATCGLGQNLYVEPDGRSYPCYTWHGEQWYMGSIIKDGLEAVVNSRRFTELREHTVNTNLLCKQCALRYLCGGVCRAWDRLPASLQTDLDAPPMNCPNQKNRARLIFLNALERLNVTEEMWSAVGFPLICDL
jgi:uncharacterized protein